MTEPLGDIYAQQARFIAELLAENDAAALRMVRAYAPVFEELTRRWQAAISDVLRAEESEKPTITLDMMKLDAERLRLLRLQTAAQIQKFAEIAGAETVAQQRIAIEVAQAHAQALTATALARSAPGFGYTFAQLPRGALEDLIGSMTDGSPLRTLFDTMGTNAADAAGNVIFRALATGINPRIAARQLRTELGIPLSRAMVISRTETLRSYRESNRRAFERNDDVCKGWRWSAQLGPRTCPSCFPSGTMVSGPRPSKSFTRHYTGDLVVIRTAGGEDLSVTPNHPILTPKGWVAAGALREGDDVLRSLGTELAPLGINVDDDDDVPTPIEQVAESFAMVSREMECSPPYFDGDGIGSDVYVVRTDRLLTDGFQALIFNPCCQLDLAVGRAGVPACCSSGFPFLRGLASLLPCIHVGTGMILEDYLSGMKRCGAGAKMHGVCECASRCSGDSQGCCDCSTSNAVGNRECEFAISVQIPAANLFVGKADRSMSDRSILRARNTVAILDTSQQPALSQHDGEPLPVNSETGRTLLRSLAGNVSRDRILHIFRRSFSGDVYNLQTGPGWYIAGGIIVHNCWAMHGSVHKLDERMSEHPAGRCSAISVTKTWAELGFPDVAAPEPLPGDRPGSEIFRGLDPATQRRILGPGKYDLYKSGAIDLEDVIARHNDPRWGVTTSEASMRGALAQHGRARPWLVHDAGSLRITK